MIKIFLFLLIISNNLFAREAGQTEITADKGIEVFQNEKYYLLKKNVKISSDEFNLSANEVKAYFSKDLYDIVILEAHSNVLFEFNNGAKGKGDYLNFLILEKKIIINGDKSFINFKNIKMSSDESLIIDDLNKKFFLKGKNSMLKTENIEIIGESIEGKYYIVDDKNEIMNLTVTDENLINIKENEMHMIASKAIYSKKDNLIELFENVKIIRNNEIIIGDYAKINTLDQTYKIISKDSNKVKLLLESDNE